MPIYKDKKGNKIEADLFKEGMEDSWKLLVSGGCGSHWKKFKTKKAALDFIEKGKGAEFITKEGGCYFDAKKINYTLYIGLGEYAIDEFGEHYIIISPYKDHMSKVTFEKKYKLVK